MKRVLLLGLSIVIVLAALAVSGSAPVDAAGQAVRASALKLFQSLTAEQKKLALLEVADKERYKEVFPPAKRPGVPFTMLTAEQKTLINEVVKAMTSEYGAQRCLEVMKETPEGGRYLTFFGEPGEKQAFAWRIGMHHLTLLFAEFGDGKSNEFGPILLGGNPAKTLWDEEEKLAIELYASLKPEELQKIQDSTKGVSSGSGGAMGKAGVRIGDLNDRSRKLAASLFAKRLDVFSAERRKVVDDIVQRGGGVEDLRFAIWGAITKSHRDGGNYHWRIGSDAVICDWQTAGKNHIHMTLRGRLKA